MHMCVGGGVTQWLQAESSRGVCPVLKVVVIWAHGESSGMQQGWMKNKTSQHQTTVLKQAVTPSFGNENSYSMESLKTFGL